MTAPAQDPARTERRRREHERQAVVFGLLIAFLAVVGLGALAVYTGAVSSPFGQPITSPSGEAAPADLEPCLPQAKGDADGAMPVAYSKIRLTILNASDTSGLAAAHAEVLGDRGFHIVTVGDLEEDIAQSELRFGVKGIRQAYTVAAQYPEMRLVLDDREKNNVDLAVGLDWERPLAEDDVTIRADQPLENRPGCVPASEITPVKQEAAAGDD